ncbi:hypothetical protein WR25_12294 [Diploscapter pachys]|uniref:Serum response factor-binding protein 1 n=1 Tax=Diploscapter pachys TaxID=2018661 RepID=A0A2A2JV79_9BILA|nr:hypothetical protein WR25_12294 [Diploscapter pachys]
MKRKASDDGTKGKKAKEESENREDLKNPSKVQEEENLLTTGALNTEIIKMRHVVDKSKRSLTLKLVRKIKEIRKNKKDADSDKNKMKIKRFDEELTAIKSIDKDSVTKFALMNKKTLIQLNITDKTPAVERVTYKLVHEKPLVEAVKAYRSKYEMWETTTAYLLQRFGKINAQKKAQELLAASKAEPEKVPSQDLKKPKAAKKEKKEPEKLTTSKADKETPSEPSISDVSDADQFDEESGDEVLEDEDVQNEEERDTLSDDDNLDSEAGRDVEDVELGSDSDEEQEAEMVEKRRRLLLGIAGIEERVERVQKIERKQEKANSKDVINKVLQRTIQEIPISLKKVEKQPQMKQSTKAPIDISKIKKPTFDIVDSSEAVVRRLDDLKDSESSEKSGKPSKKKSKKVKADNSSFLQGILTQADTEKRSEMVHPSWEAKKKMKEKMKDAQPKGKKIVFDD